MSIILRCDMCELEIEDVDAILVAIQHWLILKNPHSAHGEEHFCRRCGHKQKRIIDEQREEMAQRQENE